MLKTGSVREINGAVATTSAEWRKLILKAGWTPPARNRLLRDMGQELEKRCPNGKTSPLEVADQEHVFRTHMADINTVSEVSVITHTMAVGVTKGMCENVTQIEEIGAVKCHRCGLPVPIIRVHCVRDTHACVACASQAEVSRRNGH